ncbi:hypothetical protein Ae201684_005191 [Aphanomyces euteiches]|uniref:Uncharacterized protein n=1 Tax=Aphanomyces euteiches TaxID=100861 RepID=A0A6G0XFK9_9STRA|nr:hypothetical protein Ae201684_005191 [Aphanomyces euteiches]
MSYTDVSLVNLPVASQGLCTSPSQSTACQEPCVEQMIFMHGERRPNSFTSVSNENVGSASHCGQVQTRILPPESATLHCQDENFAVWQASEPSQCCVSTAQYGAYSKLRKHYNTFLSLAFPSIQGRQTPVHTKLACVIPCNVVESFHSWIGVEDQRTLTRWNC